MSQVVLSSLMLSLVLTLAFEIAFFLLVNKRSKKDLLLVALVNILTNPVVVLLYWLSVLYTEWNSALVTIPLELFAIVTEGYYYKKYSQCIRYPYLFSLAANMFSFWSGVFIQWLL